MYYPGLNILSINNVIKCNIHKKLIIENFIFPYLLLLFRDIIPDFSNQNLKMHKDNVNKKNGD